VNALYSAQHLIRTIEAYYQEIGRAGRDGKPANIVLLYKRGDRAIQEFFIDNNHPPEAAVRGTWDALVTLGCVVRGETSHFDYVCAESARGIAQVARDSGTPVTFGVLTTEDMDQAMARSGGAMPPASM